MGEPSRVTVQTESGQETISRHIYGHFAEHLGRCIYEGIWVGEDSPIPNTRGIRNDVVKALRQLNTPNLRWRGGCFADEYHWKDGLGPRGERKRMINTHWGGGVENNHFGTHEFMDLCEQLDCEPYVCGNVGSGTVQEMQKWIEYINFPSSSPMADLRRENGREAPWKLKYFGVGNESWGCGGHMRPEYYADEYSRYQTYIRNYSDGAIFKIACGPNVDNYHWTETLMANAGRLMSGLSLHHYVTDMKASATEFTEDGWFDTLSKALYMEELVTKHATIMAKYDPQKSVRLIVDEWGTWFAVEAKTNPAFLYQQNTLRDALVAGITLNIFNNHCDRVYMANIAQTVNVLQAMILTSGEKMIVTPSYHVFEMYKAHQDATSLPTYVEAGDCTHGGQSIPKISVSASRNAEGHIHLSLCNLHPNEAEAIFCEMTGDAQLSHASARILTDAKMTAHNTFDQPDRIKPKPYKDVDLKKNGLSLTLPPKSVVVVELSGSH